MLANATAFLACLIGLQIGTSRLVAAQMGGAYETRYAYDAAGRLTSAVYSGDLPESVAVVYTYDSSGNILRLRIGAPEAVDADAEADVPRVFALQPNYPNPFNPTTTIEYQIPRPSRVHVSVYDLLGRRIALLEDADLTAGNHAVTWDGRSADGTPAASGVYLYRIRAGEFVKSRTMVLLK